MIRVNFIRIRGVEYIDSEIGLYKCDYNYFWKHYGRYNIINSENLLEYLFRHNIEIDNDYIDLARKHFINELHQFNILKSDLFIHYYDKFELNKSLTCISYLLDKKIKNPNILERLQKAINELSYKDFLALLDLKMNDIDALCNLLLYANPNYIEEEKTLKALSKTNYSFSTLGYFKKRNLLTDKKEIKKIFSFIQTLSKDETINYIKNDEHPLFIDIISELINKEYYDDVSFARLLLPFKMTLKDKIPINVKILLIDDIINRYYNSSFDIFENNILSIPIDIILTIFSNCDNITVCNILGKLYECNHPIIKDKIILFNLLKRGCNILPFINIDELSLKEINEIKKHLHVDLDSETKKVKLHQNIFGKYKFEYKNDEILMNGYERNKFLDTKLKSGLDKFLFNFLIYSKDIEIIYDNFYEKYKNLIIKKYGEEKFTTVDDIYNFMKFILAEKKVNNELIMPNLEMIYQKLNLTNMQVEHIKELMCTLDHTYEEKINRFLMRQRKLALSKYNTIVRMHLDGINIRDALSKIGLNKDELISQIIKMRNLDKKEKSTLINLLKDEKYALTLGDILGLLQEMEENDYTIDETLRFNGVNKKYFYELYKNMVYTNKELHKKIKESLLNNKKRGFKKYIKLAYYITTLDFNDEEEFNNMFPELNLDKIIEDMEKLEKYSLATKLKEIKLSIKTETKILK